MTGTSERDATTVGRGESLADLLGGRRGAVDATVPPVAFTVGWLVAGRSVLVGVVAALVAGAVVAGWRLRRGDRPRSVLVGLLAVCVAALVAVRTGRAEDFFLVQVLANAASALAWAVSIMVRWPLLGVVVGTTLGQRGRWRRDPALLRAYGRASWVWTGTYLLRVAVFVPLYLGGHVLALTAARPRAGRTPASPTRRGWDNKGEAATGGSGLSGDVRYSVPGRVVIPGRSLFFAMCAPCPAALRRWGGPTAPLRRPEGRPTPA